MEVDLFRPEKILTKKIGNYIFLYETTNTWQGFFRKMLAPPPLFGTFWIGTLFVLPISNMAMAGILIIF